MRRHLEIDNDSVDVKLERSEDLSSLEINIELPGAVRTRLRQSA